MNNSNLPPGVTESMLPGNRPEDEACDKAVDKFIEQMDKVNASPEEYEYVSKVGIAGLLVIREQIERNRNGQ